MNYQKIFCEAAAAFSGKTALVDRNGTRALTYAELDSLSGKVAGKLLSLGLPEGTPVLIRMGRIAEYVAAYLGILKAACAAVPVSPEYPEARIRAICGDCGAKLVVTDDFFEDLESYGQEVRDASSEDVTALILYTSGSTGKPKGIRHTVRSLADGALRKPEVYDLRGELVFAASAPLSFIAFVVEYLGTFAKGGCVHMLSDEVRRDVLGMEAYYREKGITMGFLSPRVLRNFPYAGGPLERIFTASERLSDFCTDRFEIINAYGMSETAGTALTFRVDKAYANTPIGKPAEGVEVSLVDEAGREVPDGQEGEICLTGYFAQEYIGLPELTAKTFTLLADGRTLLRTGDLGKRLPDGNIVYMSRKDWMVKINGQRVETGEVEAQLRKLPGIAEAAIRDFTDRDGQTFLAAYYVSDEPFEEEKLREDLSRALPSYMIPSRFIRLEKLPLNANGKLDRGALPRPEKELGRAAYAAPENACQEAVAQAFEELLDVAKVGIDDDFFSLGGDSIKVAMLQNLLRKKGFEVSSKAVFAARTPRRISEAAGEDSGLSAFVFREAASYPLTRAQLSVYLDCQAPGRETTYNNTFGIFLPGDLEADPERLAAAAEEVFARYPVFSCAVREVDGVPSMMPGKTSVIKVQILDTDETDRKVLARRVNQPFELSEGPLLRAALFRTPEGLFLVLCSHHVVSDGTTGSLLLEQIAAAYRGEALPEEGMSAFMLAQFEAGRGDAAEDDAALRKMLDALDGETELYADDDPALAARGGKLGVFETTLDTLKPGLSETLPAKLAGQGLTESSLFMSAYAYLLRLFANQKDILFFAGENGRHDPEVRNTMGMLVHNLPVFVKIDDAKQAGDYLREMQTLFHELVGRDQADIAGILGEYGVRPDHFFVYQGEMFEGVELHGRNLPMEIFPADDEMTSLTLHVLKRRDGDYDLRFEYAAGKFREDTVRRMAEVYALVVAGLGKNLQLGEICLTTDADLLEMDAMNGTAAAYPVTDMVTLFRASAKAHPDRIAVAFKEERLTYREVDEISERIAARLAESGLGRGGVVSILIPRCTYMTTASLGVLKSGAAYQPLDPSYPVERLEFMIKDARAACVIADRSLMDRIPNYDGPVLYTDEIPALPAAERALENPKPEDLFILLYTSGSTGVPKGVMLEHQNLANFCGWYRDYYQLDENSRVAAYASYGFDANMMDQYPALTTGATVFIVEEEIRLDLLALEAWYNKNEITHAFMTTQVGRQMYSIASLPKLRYLSVGGEKLVPVPVAADGPDFYNVYGPTECTILATAMPVKRLYDRVPIGGPIGNYKCYVVDEKLRRLPPLIPGELLIAGRGVGRGYLGRPDLTEKAFIKNPFSKEPDALRAYRSGDVVRLLPDGNVDFIGRRDGQVKVRGFRIELSEVEAVIREFSGIRDATVQAFEDETTGEKYIAAYVVSDGTVDVEALNAFIRGRKPAYMVPSVTMQLDAIPLNQNQKVNKRALPKPVRQAAEIIPPQSEVQETIFECAAEVLGHREFGITTDLYEAGLSSIGAIRFNVLLSKAFDMAFATRDLKEQSTVEKLEAFIAKTKSAGADAAEDLSVRSDYPLSKTQEGIYVESIARPDSCIYNIPIILEIDPSLDTERLKTAIVKAVHAHPVLKTRLFLNEDGEARMRRMDGDFSFDEQGVEELAIDNIEEAKADLVRPFKMLGGRLFSMKLLTAGDGRRYLFAEMHHLISDGTSMGIFLTDIARAYAGEAVETEAYTAYEVVLTEAHARSAENLEKAKEYYGKLLGEAELQSLPLGDVADGTRKAPEAASAEGVFEFKGVLANAADVRAFCAKRGLSMNAFFSAAFGHLLNAVLGTPGVAFAGIYNGRSDSRLERTCAMLVKTIPIVAAAGAGESVEAYVRAMGAQLLDTQSWDLYSFAELHRQMDVNADVLFAYQGDEFGFESFCGKPSALIPVDLGAAKAPLNVSVFLKGDGIVLNIEYDRKRFSEAYIRSLAESYDAALCGFLTKYRVDEVTFLTDGMKAEIEAFNDTGAVVRPELAPARFVGAVKENADKLAVIAVSGNRRISFAELGRRAGMIASALRSLGVGRGDKVGMYMDRTENVYAIRQGILLAGAAFVGMEPGYPDDRISFILEDAGIRVLFSEEEVYAKRRGLFEEKAVRVLLLEEVYASEDGEAPGLFANPELTPEDLAYCIYTSGSTGTPKGVEITHKNLRNLLDYNDKNTLAHAYVDNSTVWLALAAITFDVSVIEEMMPIFHGKTVSMATEEEIHNPMLLADMMERTHVDMMKCTPSYMLSLLEIPMAEKLFGQLRAVILGAEPFPKGLYEKLRAKGFAGTMFNSYGPTETCVSVSIGTLNGQYVSIGGPSANTRFLIRDRFGNVLPKYMRGELVIAGDCVGKGYVGLPEKTREVFLPAGAALPGVPAYRSGDIAYFNAHGEIMHCGRNDNQVKIRGLRVELDGIENVMNTYPGIDRSVVRVLGEGDGQYLVGYYVAKAPVDEEALSAHLRKTLTAYMVPAVYVHLLELPLTANGKVNKKALPVPEKKQESGGRGRRPETELQKEIAALFARALGVSDFGLDEDFFDAGGTSMLASKVAMGAMVRNLPIAYKDVFENPTVAAMERHVLRRQGKHADATEAADAAASGNGKDPAALAAVSLDSPEIQAVLRHNTMAYVEETSLGEPAKKILLAGATGFLGAHVLRALLTKETGEIVCLVRQGWVGDAAKRMKSILAYYFETTFEEAFASGRLRVVNGDITERERLLELADGGFDMVINCAASVKHFAKDDSIERVNVTGVKNLVELCEAAGATLIHISTVSVAGENVNHALDGKILFEDRLYFGQDLSNQYVHSKFEAEKAILTEMAAGKLSAKIIRVGNLMGRNSDGEFQANAVTSGFMRSLRGYSVIGAYPMSGLARPVEFSPIDKVAEAVLLLARTPKAFSVFHAVNGHWIEMGDLVAAINMVGISVDSVRDPEFEKRLSEALADETKNMLVSGLVSYLSSDAETVRSYVQEDHTFTKNVLYRLGFRWPLTDEKYLRQSILALKSLGFFDIDWDENLG